MDVCVYKMYICARGGRLHKESGIETSSLLVHDSSPVNTVFMIYRVSVVDVGNKKMLVKTSSRFLIPERKQRFTGPDGFAFNQAVKDFTQCGHKPCPGST